MDIIWPNNQIKLENGHVEELLVAEELWNDHKKLIFFPVSSAATCTNHLLGVELRLWLPVVGVVLRLEMTSRGMRRGVSSRPQHPRVLLYFLHHRLWTMTLAHTQAALQAQLQAQVPAPVPQEHSYGGHSIMERFKRMDPPSFKGESQPLLAESWMREVEKIFRAIRCAEEDEVILATYMLQIGAYELCFVGESRCMVGLLTSHQVRGWCH
ncbi:hypothetical protein Taro_005578 [Colocasia esculenta]|uniref:Uncharacterized protein n=1 Tax=Colocasia esculenta TaxID=4460 RepID=A0A843TQ95_COLES|nr:hypothetical protein [Colocasia esculenta]